MANHARWSSELKRRATAIRAWLALVPLLWSVALLALFAQFVVYAVHAATILAYPFDIDQGEGYDVNAGWLIAQGRPIYTDNAHFPYFSSNYPPLYSIVVAGAIGLWGPTPLAGRAVSLAATLVLAVLIFVAARQRGNGAGGLVAVGAFWLSNYVYHVTPLARVNALTALLAFAGLLSLGQPRRPWRLLGGVLLVAAVFTKPTAIDAVAAGLVYLWLRCPPLAPRAAGGLGLLGLAIAVPLEVGSGGAFSLNVLFGNVNPFLPEQLRAYLANFLLLHAVTVGLAVVGLIWAVRARRLDEMHFFFLTGLGMALGVGKWGAGESYFLSAIVASCVLAGRVAGRLIERGGPLAAVVPLLFLAQSVISAHGLISARVPALPDRGLQAAALAAEPTSDDRERGREIVTELRTRDGPGLIEDPSFALAAGQEVVGNATHLRNLHQAGLWRPDNLVADLAARRYHTVVLDAELYPEPVLIAIGRYYRLHDTTVVYRARQKVFLPGTT